MPTVFGFHFFPRLRNFWSSSKRRGPRNGRSVARTPLRPNAGSSRLRYDGVGEGVGYGCTVRLVSKLFAPPRLPGRQSGTLVGGAAPRTTTFNGCLTACGWSLKEQDLASRHISTRPVPEVLEAASANRIVVYFQKRNFAAPTHFSTHLREGIRRCPSTTFSGVHLFPSPGRWLRAAICRRAQI